MKKHHIIVAVLIALFSFHYEAHWQDSSINYDGFGTGTGIIAIIAIILLFKFTSLWAKILLRKSVISKMPIFKYDFLIILGFIIPIIGYTARGETIIDSSGKSVPSWLFEWGISDMKEYFILAIIGLTLLLRVYAILNAIIKEKNSNEVASPNSDSAAAKPE
jgi:hypothetical protein